MTRSNPEALIRLGEKRILLAFRRAAAQVPAYRAMLASSGINPQDIRSIADFQRLCPVLNKTNTFALHPLKELCVAAAMENLAGVLTSSGHGARFAYGLSTRMQTKNAAEAIDLGLEYAFQVDSRKTLLINCLPMGVRFSSNSVTVAETSVREDMAVAIATEIGRFFEQIIFVGDPLFLKLVSDHARQLGVDWQKHKVHLIIGEETFGEHFRNYLAAHFHLDNDKPATGMIASSMGVAELGLNLFYETSQTIQLRRLAHNDPVFFEALFGMPAASATLPMLFVYNPLRSHVETRETDTAGYGDLTISMSDPEAPLPLLRYQTGDVARILSPGHIANACEIAGHPHPGNMPLPIIAMPGRAKDRLPDGTHIGQYKDALYVHHDIAVKLTGAFRLAYVDGQMIIHVQLRHGFEPDDDLKTRLAAQFPGNVTLDQVQIWTYTRFPFGMTLDYERKFTYYAT